MRIFRSEIETTLKMLGVATLVGLIVLPVTWGYEQRKQARGWQQIACAYRMKEVVRRAPLISTVEYERDACSTLQRLGLNLDVPR